MMGVGIAFIMVYFLCEVKQWVRSFITLLIRECEVICVSHVHMCGVVGGFSHHRINTTPAVIHLILGLAKQASGDAKGAKKALTKVAREYPFSTDLISSQ